MTVHDVAAVAKVIDFGIAKAVGQSLTAAVLGAFVVGVGALAATLVLAARAYESEARHRKDAEDAAAETDRARREALDREEGLRIELYATEIPQAHEAWEHGDLPRLRELLDRHLPRPDRPDHRGFEWHYLDACARAAVKQFGPHEFPLLSADLSPDGRLAATAGRGGVVKLWDAGTGRELRSVRYSEQEVTCVRFSPDGKRLATCGQDRTVRVWDIAGWTESVRVLAHIMTVTRAGAATAGASTRGLMSFGFRRNPGRFLRP